MFPPHLPNPAVSIKKHYHLKRIKFVVAAAFFGLLAGVAGAAIMLGFIWPRVDTADTWAITRYNTTLSARQLEQRVRSEITKKIFTVYRTPTKLGQAEYLDDSTKLGEALVISSEGWLVMGQAGNLDSYGNWRALSFGGTVYEVDKIVLDNYANLVYLHLDNKKDVTVSFEVVSFSDKLLPSEDLFVYHGGIWQHSLAIDAYNESFLDAQLDIVPLNRWRLNSSFTKGEIVLNKEGRVVGLMAGPNSLMSALTLTRVVPTVLSSEKVVYPSLGIKGFYSNTKPIVTDGIKQAGFLVSSVEGNRSVFRRGDVVQKINGQEINAEVIWSYQTGSTVRVELLRAGTRVELEAEILEF